MCPGTKQLSPAMAPHPSAAASAATVLLNGPVESVGSPILFQAPGGSLFYPLLDEIPSIAHPVEIFSTRQDSMTSYTDNSKLGTCSFSIFGTTSSSSSSASHNTSPGFTRLSLARSYRRARRKEATCADAPDNPNQGEGEKQHPLYCSICRVTLNAQIQARQHYSGKQHARRLRILSRGRSEGEDGGLKVKATSVIEGLRESMTTDWTSNQVYLISQSFSVFMAYSASRRDLYLHACIYVNIFVLCKLISKYSLLRSATKRTALYKTDTTEYYFVLTITIKQCNQSREEWIH